jgi:type 1 glutamine amidotransferase
MTTIEDPGKDKYPGEVFGELFPGAWCHEFEGGKVWYTSYGHHIKHYSDENYRQHVLGGILWTIN